VTLHYNAQLIHAKFTHEFSRDLLVRILTDDPGQAAQVKSARALASQAQQVFILLVVQVEIVWALEYQEIHQAFV
jgi:hypothetical protein